MKRSNTSWTNSKRRISPAVATHRTATRGWITARDDVNFELHPNAIAHSLRAWFGSSTSSLVTADFDGANSGDFAGAGQQYHKFTPTQTAFSDRTFLEPYNVAVYRDVQSAWLFKGSIFPTLKLMIKQQALVKGTGTIMSRGKSIFSTSLPG
jgi:hypothetical protein